MKIAQVATLCSPVRQFGSGSVEYLVWLLSRQLAREGHDVTVYGVPGSQVDGRFVATVAGPHQEPGTFPDWYLSEWINLCRAVQDSQQFDLIHTHAYLWGIPLEPLSHAPMVHTLHVVPEPSTAGVWSLYPEARVTATSQQQWADFPHLKPTCVIPHGFNIEDFTFCAEPADYVCYFGQFTAGKGALDAVSAAKALGLPLVMAGPANEFYWKNIAPLIDGQTVIYAGYATGKDREDLLGGARALLYPIRKPESFGLVLVEAMLCGTPVAAIDLGAVREVVDEGVTGAIASTMADFSDAITKALALDRRRVREQAASRFSAERMTKNYLSVYEKLVRGQ